MWHPRPVSPKSKGRKKGRAQQARQAGAQQIRARQVLPLRVLTAQDADGVAAKLVSTLPPGPLLFRRLVRDVLPASVVLPTRVADDVSQAMRAWARWAAGRCDLPKRLRRRLLAELEDDLRDFRARLAEANRAPASALRANICTEATLQRLGSALEKRLELV